MKNVEPSGRLFQVQTTLEPAEARVISRRTGGKRKKVIERHSTGGGCNMTNSYEEPKKNDSIQLLLKLCTRRRSFIGDALFRGEATSWLNMGDPSGRPPGRQRRRSQILEHPGEQDGGAGAAASTSVPRPPPRSSASKRPKAAGNAEANGSAVLATTTTSAFDATATGGGGAAAANATSPAVPDQPPQLTVPDADDGHSTAGTAPKVYNTQKVQILLIKLRARVRSLTDAIKTCY